MPFGTGARSHPSSTYLVLAAAALGVNVLIGWALADALQSAFVVATMNVAVAVLVRNELLLTVLYRVAVGTLRGVRAPLRARTATTAALLHIGGVHAGCACASLGWLVVGLVSLAPACRAPELRDWVLLVLAWALLVQLIVVAVWALPALRTRRHDQFELTHRFVGWSSLVTLWAFVLLAREWSPALDSRARVPGQLDLALTIVVTALVASPWLSVRKVPVTTRSPSRSLIEVTLPGGCSPGTFGRISRSPLADWHAFALVPRQRAAPARSMIISRAGDFTTGLLTHPPSQLYTRRVAFPGLPCCVPLFRRSVIIASGAGIAPYLSVLPLLPPDGHRVIWVGRSFRESFGDEFCDLVQQWPDLVLVDTAVSGRPDLVGLAVSHYHSVRAEAVFVGSNPAGTRAIIEGCRAAGIPAFGPSWDS